MFYHDIPTCIPDGMNKSDHPLKQCILINTCLKPVFTLISAAGIPDFRSPGTGLYDNLQKYNLPSPQAMFEINFFKVRFTLLISHIKLACL